MASPNTVPSERRLVPCTTSPLSGLWRPETHLGGLFYGPGCVTSHLRSVLPSEASRVFIVTGASLYNKTSLVQELERLLGDNHAGTFAGIKQHGHLADVDAAFAELRTASLQQQQQQQPVDTIVSVGGGSPIDSAKTLSYWTQQASGHFLTHIAIPTTLSAAECTAGGGYTDKDGVKVGFMCPGLGVKAIFYDPTFTRHTPPRLLLSTGIRALDHAVETVYHPNSSEVPWKALASTSIQALFECLPAAAKILQPASQGNTTSTTTITTDGQPPPRGTASDDILVRLHLAAWSSAGLRGSNFGGGMGLSHSLGHALGSPYGIPHGDTSCMTLASVVRLMARHRPDAAAQISRLCLPSASGKPQSEDKLGDSMLFASCVEDLVAELGLVPRSLGDWGVKESEIPVILQRAMRGPADEKFKQDVECLVRGLF